MEVSSFQMFRYLSEDSRIPMGVLDLTFDDQNNTVKICKSGTIQWNAGFTFTLLTAQSANGLRPSGSEDRIGDKLWVEGRAKVQTPINDVLNIFLSQSYPSGCSVTIRLLDTNGQTVMVQHFDAISSQFSLPVESLSAGFYILRLETEGETQTYKVIKSE